MKPIETQYKGYRFRSRLEARWAVFFEYLFIEWEYEKEGYVLDDGTMYLPDFWIPLDKDNLPGWGYWIEIKANEPTEAEMIKAQLLSRGTGHTTYIFWGDLSRDNWHTVIFKGQNNGDIYINHGWYVSTTAVFCDDHNCHHLPLPNSFRLSTAKWVIPPFIDLALDAARSARFEHKEYRHDIVWAS